MGRHLRLPLALLWLAGLAAEASGQALGLPKAVAYEASMRGGRVEGTVTDQAGVGLEGATLVALGGAVATARTDASGRFTLALSPGDYVLRAARDGYISTYRELVRVQADISLRRNITLTKAGPVAQAVLLAGIAGAERAPDPIDSDVPSERTEGDAAWRLRHLPRTVLRDVTPLDLALAEEPARLARRTSFVDWIVAGSARSASSFIMDTDFNGQVNFLTTGAMAGAGAVDRRPDLARGVAYVVVGAPVGSYGDWSVRGAAAAGDLASWTLLTEYRAKPRRAHAFRAGFAYSAQIDLVPDAPHAPTTGRRVGGLYVLDRWTMGPNVAIDYGGRIDRYDYLAQPALASGNLGFSVRLLPQVRMTWSAASRMVAPGAEQFLPPSTAGPWLPPERTFSMLRSRSALSPENVERYDVGFEADLGTGQVVSLRRFSESVRNQMVALFGLDAASEVGHYYIASPGDVVSDGWAVAVSGAMGSHISGRLEYIARRSDWTPLARLVSLSRVSPSSIRTGGHGHDLTASIDAALPRVATHVNIAVRLSDEFSAPSREGYAPIMAGRFKLEIQQQLPYHPVRGGELNIVVTLRTLLRDLDAAGSMYDELLTVRPPLRVTSGVQMRF